MEKWARLNYQPCLPLGDNNSKITGCKAHIDLSREAAREGIVMLKNDNNVLPLKHGTKIAIFGTAQIDYVKCGGGSGTVFSEYTRHIYSGIKEKNGGNDINSLQNVITYGNKVDIFDKLSLYYEAEVTKAYKEGKWIGRFEESDVPSDLLEEAKEFTDTAIITISRAAGEGEDRYNDGKDTYFILSEREKEMISTVCDNFEKVIVLLNIGAMMDTSWFADNDKIQSVLIIWQGGMEGGLAAADILTGDANPSGKLVDTCARDFFDYPSSDGFHESEDYVKYTEDVFVGYRYFETIPGKKDCVVYPFGYGLSYTTFEFSNINSTKIGEKILVSVDVTNTGTYAGKEVVQVYYSAPVGKITKPAIELCAFKKTKLLEPGEKETIVTSFDISSMASYDDTGIIEKSAYVLEAGDYKIFVGNSVRNLTQTPYVLTLNSDEIVEKLTEYSAPDRLGKRLTASGEYINVPDEKHERKTFPCEYVCEEKIPESDENIHKLIDVAEGKISLDDFVAQLTDEELMRLLRGIDNKGVCNVNGIGELKKYGIPPVMMADGPAGLRINPQTGIHTTAFPIATMLACTWNTELVERVGAAGALEVKENNISVWLTPALNIHRSPLCGRNFEYFSEDPLISGKMAAAKVRGIQSQGIIATPKHFACNNKETNRFESDSIVSERAMREIYLKGFEICVKESNPKLIMTAYNLINGVRASESAELIQGILRNEWGYKGLVTTDWSNHASMCAEVIAGNDIHMPKVLEFDINDKYAEGKITRNQIAICVKRLCEMILSID